MEWVALAREDVNEDTYEEAARERGSVGNHGDHARFAKYLFMVMCKDGVNAWRPLHMEYTPVTSAARIHEEVAGGSHEKRPPCGQLNTVAGKIDVRI